MPNRETVLSGLGQLPCHRLRTDGFLPGLGDKQGSVGRVSSEKGGSSPNLWLAAMGGEDRAGTRPWIPLALATKVSLDALFGAKLTVKQWTRHRAFCSWCLLAASASVVPVPLVVPEARAALRRIDS